jgi:hypothetical protein
VVAVEALRENERGDETQFTTKIDGKTSFGFEISGFVKIIHSQFMQLMASYYAQTKKGVFYFTFVISKF